jgi:hypothetical protein
MTDGIPGLMMRSVYTGASGAPLLNTDNYETTVASPISQRWGGWYVTGTTGSMRHMGNLVIHAGEEPETADLELGTNLTDLSVKFDTEHYLSPGSDIVALMVLAHQTQLHNLITNANYQTRIALQDAAVSSAGRSPTGEQTPGDTQKRIKDACEPLVRGMLFCEEAPLTDAVKGTSTFARDFAAAGPRDKAGRSLRDFDLTTRLFKYPCSYLIYTESFTALPGPAKDYIYQRLWDVLTGKDTSKDFDHLSPADRRAIIEILRGTITGLPAYWKNDPPAK